MGLTDRRVVRRIVVWRIYDSSAPIEVGSCGGRIEIVKGVRRPHLRPGGAAAQRYCGPNRNQQEHGISPLSPSGMGGLPSSGRNGSLPGWTQAGAPGLRYQLSDIAKKNQPPGPAEFVEGNGRDRKSRNLGRSRRLLSGRFAKRASLPDGFARGNLATHLLHRNGKSAGCLPASRGERAHSEFAEVRAVHTSHDYSTTTPEAPARNDSPTRIRTG